MLLRRAAAYPALALILLAGCAVRQPQSAGYRLVSGGKGSPALLVPPGAKNPAVVRRKLDTGLARGTGQCESTEGIAVAAGGRTVRVVVERGALEHRPDGWLSRWSADAERSGCVASGQAQALSRRIAEALPLPTNTAYRLLHPNHLQSGYVDLTPHQRLQMIAPVLKPGTVPGAPIIEEPKLSAGTGNCLNLTARATSALIGYETAWYAIQPKASGVGFSIAPLSAERHFGATIETSTEPLNNPMHFPDSAAFYRLFYKSSPSGDVVSAVILGAPSRAELDRRMREGACDNFCVEIPRRVAVNAFVVVTVNGNLIALQVGGTVRTALQDAHAGNPAGILPHLKLSKPYAAGLAPVHFDSQDDAVLDLILEGGENIAWQ